MGTARGTPRFVEAIGPAPVGPQLMGPHEAVAAPSPAPAPAAHPPRRGSSGIIPLHPHGITPRYSPVVSHPPVAATPAAPRARRAEVVPVERRPWRVLIVSASPGAAPRSFMVARWQARTAVVALAVLTLLAGGFVAAVVVAVRTPDLFSESADVQALRAELAATQDSLATLRASDEATEGDSVAAPEASAPAPEAAPARPVVRPDRPKPLSARPARRTAEAAAPLALMPRSLEELPVIGAIASGFSRARRHPLLRIIRPHLGVDVAAPRGTRVSAPAAGRVRFVGRKFGFGLVVELDHGQGIVTRYAHLRSAAVEEGEQVTKGEAIAAVGTSGISTGPHLHYEVLVHGKQVDPLRFRFAQVEPVVTAPAPSVAVPIVQPAAPSTTGAAASAGMHDAASAPASPSPR